MNSSFITSLRKPPIYKMCIRDRFEPVFNLGNTLTESFSRFNQVERICKKLPGLDCGSCGAPTCKALAEDIVRGEADEKDCIYYLRENLHKLTEEVTIMADYLIDGENFGDEAVYVLRECVHKIADEDVYKRQVLRDTQVTAVNKGSSTGGKLEPPVLLLL